MSTDNPWFTITKLQELKNKIPMMHNAHRGLRGDKTIPTTTLTLHHIAASDKTISSSDTRVKLVQGWQCLIVPDRVVSLSIYLIWCQNLTLCVESYFKTFTCIFIRILIIYVAILYFKAFFPPKTLAFHLWWNQNLFHDDSTLHQFNTYNTNCFNVILMK